MSTKNQDLGSLGEEKAVKFLKNSGFQVRNTNWRHKHLEVDIIAQLEETLVFIEVKTRSNSYFGQPESFVNHKKQELLIRAAAAYLELFNLQNEVRFDVISIIKEKTGKIVLNHIENAFYPSVY